MLEPAAAAKRISEMKKFLVALVLVAGCSSDEERQSAGNQTAAPAESAQPRPQPQPQGTSGARLASLGGLYEGGPPDRRHQMCIVEADGADRFGLVVWGSNMHSCSGSGSVRREGNVMRLSMAGDSACTIDATISGTTVKMPANVPAGCSYYCGPRAKLTGVELTQTGTKRADAMRAKDLVGESLCSGEGE